MGKAHMPKSRAFLSLQIPQLEQLRMPYAFKRMIYHRLASSPSVVTMPWSLDLIPQIGSEIRIPDGPHCVSTLRVADVEYDHRKEGHTYVYIHLKAEWEYNGINLADLYAAAESKMIFDDGSPIIDALKDWDFPVNIDRWRRDNTDPDDIAKYIFQLR